MIDLSLVFSNVKDPFRALWEEAERGEPYAILHLHSLLEELSSFPFLAKEREVLSLSPGKADWEPEGAHQELEVREGKLYLEGEVLVEANPFPSFGKNYTLWVAEDRALSSLFGEETAFLNVALAQVAEVNVGGQRLVWVKDKRALPTHPLLALAHSPSTPILTPLAKEPLFHPDLLVNLPFITQWPLSEVEIVGKIVEEAFRWGQSLLLNEGKGLELFHIPPFERVEGTLLLEWALAGEHHLRPSPGGWQLADEWMPGRITVSAVEDELITLRQRVAKRDDAFSVRELHFVRRRVAGKVIFSRVES